MDDQNSARLTQILRDAVYHGKYLIGVTILKQNGTLEHHLESCLFPVEDMLPAHNKIRELIISSLEKETAKTVAEFIMEPADKIIPITGDDLKPKSSKTKTSSGKKQKEDLSSEQDSEEPSDER